MHRGKLISRRDLVASWAAAFAGAATVRARDQAPSPGKPGSASGELPVRLVRAVPNAAMLDVSADSEHICLYYTRHPTQSYTWNGSWKENSLGSTKDDALRVVERDSWASTYATRLPAKPNLAGFFADGQSLYVETSSIEPGGAVMGRLLIDLRTGQVQQRQDHLRQGIGHFSYRALAGRELLGLGTIPDSGKTGVIVKVQAPDYREIQRVPFAETRSPAMGHTEGPVTVSADRSTFVYTYDRNVVCRRTSDLGIIWSRETDPSLALWHAAMSCDARLVAAYVCDYTGIGQAKNRYVLILDGKDGREVTRVSADGLESLAVSTERQLLAAGQRVPIREGRGGTGKAGTQPTVFLFDLRSGRQVAELIQDQLYGGGKEYLTAGVDTRFMLDGKFLITSGLNTRVWQIG